MSKPMQNRLVGPFSAILNAAVAGRASADIDRAADELKDAIRVTSLNLPAIEKRVAGATQNVTMTRFLWDAPPQIGYYRDEDIDFYRNALPDLLALISEVKLLREEVLNEPSLPK